MDTKLRCSEVSRCSSANCSSSIAACRASMRWLPISSIALLRKTTAACAISPISSPAFGLENIDVGVVRGEPAHPVGKVQERAEIERLI